MSKRIYHVKASKLTAYREVDFRGKEYRKYYGGAFSGAGLLGTGAPTYPRKWRWVENGVIVNQYHIDITGLACKGDAANDVIALAAGGAGYLDQVTTATHGLVFRSEMWCLEAPGEGTATITADIDIGYDTLATLVYDGAADGAAIASGGSWTVGRTIVSEDQGTVMAPNVYLYITEGDNAATTGVYNAGKFVVRTYGMAAFTD